MAVTIAQLNAVLGVDNSGFNTKIQESRDVWDRFKLVLAGAAGGIASEAISSLVNLGQQVVQTTLDFQEGLGSIGSLTGQTGEALQQLQGVASDAFLHMTQNMKEVSEATAILTDRTHLTGQALENLLRTEGNVARATGQDLRSVIDGSTLSMNKWGFAGKDMAAEMDVLLGVSQRTGTGINVLTEDLRRGGSQLQDMGFSFDQAAQLMGKMEAGGINVSQVMFGLRQAVGKLSDAHIPLHEGFIQIVKMLSEETDKSKQLSEATQLLGKRTGEELVLALRNGTLSLADFTAEVDKSAGASAKAAAQANPLKDSITELGHAWVEFLSLGKGQKNGLTEYFHDAAIALKEFGSGLHTVGAATQGAMDRFNKFMEAHHQFSAQQHQADIDNQNADTNLTDTHARYLNYLETETEHVVNMKATWKDMWDSVKTETGVSINEMMAQHDKYEVHVAAGVAKLGEHKEKKQKLTELQTEEKAFAQLAAQTQADWDALQTGVGVSTAKLLGHFHAMVAAGEGAKLLALASQRGDIAHAKAGEEAWRKYDEQVKAVEERIVKAAAGGLASEQSVATMNRGLIGQKGGEDAIKVLAERTRLAESVEKDEANRLKMMDESNQMDKRAVDLVANLQSEYLRLTHTRYEDIAALDIYHKTFEEVQESARQTGDLTHTAAVLDATDRMRQIDRLKAFNAETKKQDEQVQALFKHWDELQLKLAQATPMEEAGRAAREMLTPFDKLPEARKMVEENAEANRAFGTSFVELDDDLQMYVDAILAWEHALALKNKTDAENDAANKRSDDMTKKMTDHLAELSQKIRQFSDPNVNKQSKFVTDVIAEQLKLTEAQKKMLDQIIAQEKQLSDVEKHAAAMKKFTAELNQGFTKLFDDLMSGHKNAFASLEKDFETMLQKMAAKYLASQLSKLLMNLVGSVLGGDNPGGVTIRKAAIGGNLAPGEMAMVGERGPELFQSNQAGQIIPNNQVGQGRSGGVTVNMTVNAQDANSFRLSQNQMAAQLGAAITRATMRGG